MQQYIRLLTARDLTDQEMDLWFDTVLKFTPPGVPIYDEDEDLEVEVEDEDIADDGFPYVYVVHLTRHLNKTEAEFIVSAWEMRYGDDFEIEASNLYDPDKDMQHPFEIEMEDDVYENIKETAAKFMHNRWVESKNLDGWRYATRLSIGEKTHPAMRDWDSLHNRYKKYPTMTKTEALDFYTKYKHLFN